MKNILRAVVVVVALAAAVACEKTEVKSVRRSVGQHTSYGAGTNRYGLVPHAQHHFDPCGVVSRRLAVSTT